mmetsp:Transcript_14813/g.27418  ORF Transcript_14813/g.27418 Transcript_14813/m.27418 type:complete len:107 (-) Transcript_14813:1407-1727(-)
MVNDRPPLQVPHLRNRRILLPDTKTRPSSKQVTQVRQGTMRSGSYDMPDSRPPLSYRERVPGRLAVKRTDRPGSSYLLKIEQTQITSDSLTVRSNSADRTPKISNS